MATDSFFQATWDGYSTQFGVSSVVATSLSTAAGWMQVVLGLFVLITGFLIAFGSLTWASGVSRVIRGLLIVAVLTPAFYNEYIVQGFTQTIPNEIATAVGRAPTQSSVVEVFDQLLAATEAMMAQVNASAGLMNLGKVISAYIAAGIAELALLGAFVIWFLTSALVNVIVCLGPFVLPFWLFDATKQIPHRLFSKLIGYMLLLVLVLITTQIVQAQQRSYIASFASLMIKPPANVPSGLGPRTGFMIPDGMLVPDEIPSGPVMMSGGNLDQQVSLLWKVALSFLFGAVVMCLLPGIAAYIGGGVAVGMGPILVTGYRNIVGGR